MANYSDDFDALTPGAGLPAGWTQRWDTGAWSIVDDAGNVVIRNSDTVSNRHVASWDIVDSDADRANVEVLGRVRTSSQAANQSQCRFLVRGSGTGTSETGYVFGLANGVVEIGRYNNAVAVTLGSIAKTITTNTLYWLRFRANGSLLQGRMWADGDVEPSTWDVEVSDTVVAAAGWVGFFSFYGTTGKTHDFAEIAVATAGDTATFSGGTQALEGAAVAEATASGWMPVDQTLEGSAAAVAGTPAARLGVEFPQWQFVGSATASVASGDFTLALPTAGPLPAWYGVDYNPVLGLHVAVGEYGAVTTSPDGITWTPRMSGVGNVLQHVCHRPSDGLMIAVGAGGTILASDDGKTWTRQVSPGSIAIAAYDLFGVCYSEVLGLFVAVGYLGRLLTSTDGITWTEGSSGVTSTLYAVSYSNNMVVAGGSSGAIVSSPDGITWTIRTGAWSSAIYAVTYAAGLFVACSTTVFLTSPDGITWTQRTSGLTGYTRGIVHDGSQFISVATIGDAVTSPDGITWTVRTTGNTIAIRAITYDAANDLLVAVGVANLRLTTPDGVTWTNRTPMWSGLLDGDLLVAMIAYRDSVAFTLPAGWTLIAQQSSGNISEVPADSIASGLMAYCIRGAADPDLVFTRTGGDVAHGHSAVYRPM